MLKHKTLFLRRDLVGLSGFSKGEGLFVSKLRCKPSFLSAFWSPNDVGTKTIQFQPKIEQKGFRGRNFSSQVLELMDRNAILEENTNGLYLPSTYDTAMEALSSLISRKSTGERLVARYKYEKLRRMQMYLKIMGLEEDIADLKIIHVAGTKGKGSTCTFCEAILRECGFRTGLFTSPHLIDVRERFRLNGCDISEEKFLHYFWKCWNQLKENLTEDLPMPPLFQFLTVLALKIFSTEKVDVAIIEVGLGGTRDSTNVIKHPLVCGISSLGMDHMESLGDTLAKIASHKAGIFKHQVPAFTVQQPSEAMDVLQATAKEKMVPLEVVTPLDSRKLNGMQLSLSGEHQFTNAGLAVALCRSWIQITGNWERLFPHADTEDCLPEPFSRGLSTARLSGRAEIVYDPYLAAFDAIGHSSGDLIFYLDGAHSPESLEACAKWFSSAIKEVPAQSPISSISSKLVKQILLFNCMDVRDPEILLPKLFNTCASSGTYFAKAIFVPSLSKYNKVTSGSSTIPLESPSTDVAWQLNLQKVWETIIHREGETDTNCNSLETRIPGVTPPQGFIDSDATNCSPTNGQFTCSTVVSSLPLTIDWLRSYAKENPSYRIQVLVTGSLHLVGDVLKLLRGHKQP